MKHFIFSALSFCVLCFGLENPMIAQKRYTTFEIDAPQLAGKKRIWLYLPLAYNKTNKRYPVLYMHDAQNLFDAGTSYAGEWKVDETLDSLKIEVIVVGIEHGNDKRVDELTPFQHKEYGGGNANAYLDFMVTTLKPYIDSNYRTKTKARHTTIFGSSLGGLVSFYAVLQYPNLFGKAGVFSPSFWFSPTIYDYTKKTEVSKAKLYFLCGDSESEDMVSDMQRITKLVANKRQNGKQLTKEVVIKDGKHHEKMWSEQFGNAVLWLLN